MTGSVSPATNGSCITRVFLTGATGFNDSYLVPELIGAGRDVVGLSRSDSGADALSRWGATVVRGPMTDLDCLRAAAGLMDGVIHAAFDHDPVDQERRRSPRRRNPRGGVGWLGPPARDHLGYGIGPVAEWRAGERDRCPPRSIRSSPGGDGGSGWRSHCSRQLHDKNIRHPDGSPAPRRASHEDIGRIVERSPGCFDRSVDKRLRGDLHRSDLAR